MRVTLRAAEATYIHTGPEALLTLLPVGFAKLLQSPAVLVSSYLTVSPLPTNRRFTFCGTVPRITPGGYYPPLCSTEPGLSSSKRSCPTHSRVDEFSICEGPPNGKSADLLCYSNQPTGWCLDYAVRSRWGRNSDIATHPVVRSSAGAGLLPIGRDINTSEQFCYALAPATVRIQERWPQ